ncbi:chitobiase/beta-hexosaminidase C-terminal domain-containing protein [Marasmitruncus massiliensis]|uniref:chitobiase/beta-hexosaminidase C-terminal domain-containing protein n=1 Tax=Marasmitruncus massiliensis TaxID=1944642 RepID=UPI000C7B8FC7|nr:chitobiase/beta-hexosaminidase C-terminal domain-containing protein [Marasmitruncus massiliensis]
MAINLVTKHAKQIATRFVQRSLIAGRLSEQYSWAGAKTVVVYTPQTVPLGEYQRTGTNRYGTPTEMQDIVQEMTLTQDKGFALTIDKGNNKDQNGIKSAGRMLALQIDERCVPTLDAYVFSRLAQLAGFVVGNPTALTKSTVCDRISEGTVKLDDSEVPQDNRTLFVSASTYKMLRLSEEFIGVDKLAAKSLTKGQVGEYDGMPVIKVPKGRWPANVNFMIVYKNSATAPVKINETKLHQDPPGISGNLLEGRMYYDCFVLGAKCDGVYVEINTGSGAGTVLAKPTIAAATGEITVPSGATCKYTTDGTDPRYSKTAQIGTSAGTGVGTVVKAYCYKDGSYPSEVAEATLTA